MCTADPEFGNIVESSANTNAKKAKRMIDNAPTIQERTLKDPACIAA